MDLMATPASVHKKSVESRGTQEDLPFYPRYHTHGCAVKYFGFCFPPTNMVGVMLQHLEECQAQAVLIVPDQKQSWFPRLARARVKARILSTPRVLVSHTSTSTDEGSNTVNPDGALSVFCIHHQRGREPFRLRKSNELAVEANFCKAWIYLQYCYSGSVDY